jgi:hypothetical protein
LISSGVIVRDFDSTRSTQVVRFEVAGLGGGRFAMRCILVVLSLPLVSLALAGGCSGNSAGGPDASIDGSGVILPGLDAGSGEAGGEGGTGATTTTMRLAHASPGLGPIDFCWRPTGTVAFTGPVLGGAVTPVDAGVAPDTGAEAAGGELPEGGETDGTPDAWLDAAEDAAADDASATMLFDATAPFDAGAGGGPDGGDSPDVGAPAALLFGGMTPDVTFPTSGTFDIALVTAGQTSCLQPLPRLVDQVTLDAGKRSTVVVMGVPSEDAGASALSLAAFVDAPAVATSTRARFIHAALGTTGQAATPALSVHAGATLVAAEVDPGNAATASPSPLVDSLGYSTLDPIAGTVTIGLATLGDVAQQWTTPATALGLELGSTHTGILVSLGQGALGVAWCGDVADAGGRTSCTLITALP